MTIEELEGYFTGIELPDQIELETGVVIVDVPLFLQSHFDYIKDNPTLKSIDVFMLRLHKAMGIIEAKGEEEESAAISAPIQVVDVQAVGNVDPAEIAEPNTEPNAKPNTEPNAEPNAAVQDEPESLTATEITNSKDQA